MKMLALLSIWLALPLCAQSPTVPSLQVRIAQLLLENSSLQAKNAGLEAQVKNLEQQIQLQKRLELMNEFCPPIPLEKCEITQDGTAKEAKAK